MFQTYFLDFYLRVLFARISNKLVLFRHVFLIIIISLFRPKKAHLCVFHHTIIHYSYKYVIINKEISNKSFTSVNTYHKFIYQKKYGLKNLVSLMFYLLYEICKSLIAEGKKDDLYLSLLALIERGLPDLSEKNNLIV